ncbi:hypothetical protein ACLMJK_009093 [Lecanora helva]
MSAQVWPPISHEALIKAEEEHLAAELEWLLSLLQENLASLKSGLQECVDLLAPHEPGSTLALSSLRSESVKGFVTMVGTRIIKGDISLRLLTHPPHRTRLTSPVPLPQLHHLHTLLHTSLDILDIATYTGDPTSGPFISSQLKLLSDTISEACATLKGGDDAPGSVHWFENAPVDWDPELPNNLSLHLSIVDAAVVLQIRTLFPSSSADSSLTGLSLRTRLGLGPKTPIHDELDQTFQWQGGEVVVREKVRVEAQDPGLLAVMAKLSAVGHAVQGWRAKVGVVMGEEVEAE